MKSYFFKETKNFGDEWTSYAFKRLFDVDLEYSTPHDAQVFGVGSIASQIPSGFSGDVLGSGFMHDYDHGDLSEAYVWGLRGKLTRSRVTVCGEPALGDPVLISDRFVPKVRKKFQLGIVPHYVDKSNPTVQLWGGYDGITVIDVQAGVETVLRGIAECEQVVSSSLHGCVAADALGVPNNWTKFSDKVAGNGFKFRDYYSVFGLNVEPCLGPGFVSGWRRPGLQKIKENLWKMFEKFAQARQLRLLV